MIICLFFYIIVSFQTQGVQPPVLVFVQDKHRAQQLYEEIKWEGISVQTIHAGKEQRHVSGACH